MWTRWPFSSRSVTESTMGATLQKRHEKAGLYNLNDGEDEELTHLGRSLAEIDEFTERDLRLTDDEGEGVWLLLAGYTNGRCVVVHMLGRECVALIGGRGGDGGPRDWCTL